MKPEEFLRESLEARLRALLQPEAPAGLKARLIADIPEPRPLPQQARISWITVICLLAFVGSLIAVVVLSLDSHGPTPTIPTGAPVVPRPADDSANDAQWVEARRVLNGADLSPFAWPLEERSPARASSSIPADLLD